MAKKYGQALAEVKVYINGKEQAARDLDTLKEKAEGLKNEIKETKKLREEAAARQAEALKRANAATEGSVEHTKAVQEMLKEQMLHDELTKKLTLQKEERKQLNKVIRETEKFSKDIAEDLDNLSGQSIQRLKEIIRQLDAIRTKLKPEQDPDGKLLNLLNEAITEASETIKNKKGDLIEFSDIMDDLTNIDDTSLEKAEQRLRSLLAATDKDDVERIKQLKDELNQVTGEKNRRLGVQAESIMGGDYTKTIEGTKEAIDLLEKYKLTLDTTDAEGLKKVETAIAEMNKELMEAQKSNAMETLTKNLNESSTQQIKQSVDILIKYRETLKPLSPEWQKVNDAIETGKEKLKSLVDQTKLQAMTAQYKNLGDLSKSALSNQKKYWQEMVDGAAAGSKELAEYEKRLAKVVAEEQKRAKEQAGKVMNNLSGYSVDEIKEAIKATEQLRDAQKPGSKAWAEYAAQVKNANDYLDSFKNKAQFEAMNTQFKNLSKLSADALAEQKKYWQAMVNGADNGSKELEQYRKKLAEVTEEERRRSAESVKSVMKNPAKYSVEEIKEAIKVTEQLRDAQKPGSKAWREYATQIENANGVLDKFKDKAKIETMAAQFRNLGTLSKSALAEQKKFWQTMADGADKGSRELELYETRLRTVIAQEKTRTKEEGKKLASSVLDDSWTGTVGEAKEAVKILKEYKDTLNTTDTSSIKRVDKAISELTNKTKIAETGFKSTNEALKALWRQTKNLGQGNWKGSIAELEEMRRKLIAIRDTQDKVLNAKDRDRLQKSLRNVDKEIAILKGDAIDINYILANMKDTPLWKLEKAASQLQQEIKECSEASSDFAEKAAQLRRVNKQVDSLKKKFKETDNVIIRTARRLMAYVAIYGGFNFAIGKIKEVIQANLQLSDSYADIQKTTGLSAEQVKDLSKSIDSIDTRTTQQQLHELAAVAGQLGLKSQTDILGFVRAANMISVSLNELGAEGTSSLMKIATLTGEASQGTEQALLKIGSAINELTANSTATAGPIVDLMKRMGGVASQAGLTSAQMAAIGATADALGQSMEITGTSMNKFVTTLMSSSDDIAYALNMDAKALRDMLDEGKTMEAMISVFERMQKMGGMDKLAGVMGDLGSEGARMTQVLTALAKNVDFLKTQVDLSTEAYKDANSIQDEYNIKNENALAIWQRIGNMLKELFVNSWFVDILTSISRGIYNVLSLLIESENFFKILAASIAATTAALYANTAEWVKNYNAMGAAAGAKALWAKVSGGFRAVWDTTISTIKGGTKAMWGATKAAWAAAEGTNAFKKACDLAMKGVKNLASFLSRNWLTAAIAAVSALVAWFVTAKLRVTELERATARYHREVEEEKNKVDALFSSLGRLNNKEEDRAKIISTINQQYGDYLGFMLSEKDSAEKLAAAHKLINSELERRMALNLQNTLQGKASNTYAEEYEEASTGISKVINNGNWYSSSDLKGKVNASKVTTFVTDVINQIVSASVITDKDGKYRQLGEIDEKAVMDDIKARMQEKFNHAELDKNYAEGLGFGGAVFERTSSWIEDLLEARIEYMEDILEAEKTADLEMGRIAENAEQFTKDMLKQTEKDIETLKKVEIPNNWTEEQTQEHYANLLHQLRTYVDQSETIRKNMSAEEKKQYEKDMRAKEDAYKTYYNEIAPLAGEDPWGKTLNVSDWKDFADIVTNLDTASAESLASAYKKITEDTAKIPSNVKKFYEMFKGTGLETKLKLQSPDDIAKQVHSWAEQIKEKLATKYGRNTSLGFIFESGGSGGDGASEAEKEARKQYNAVMAALEAHFLKRKQAIQDNYLAEKITGEEMNRQIADNEEAHLRARVELRKKLLGQSNTFEQEQYEELAGKNIEQTGEFLRGMGDVMTDGIAKNLEQDEVKVREGMIKIRQAIEEEMLKYDIFGKFENDFAETMDKLQLLTTQLEKDTAAALQGFGDQIGVKMSMSDGSSEEDIKKKIKELMLLAEKSYTVNAEGLKEMALGQTEYYTWWGGLNEKQLNDMLVKLRDYYDNVTLLREQYQKRMEREFEGMYKQTGQQKIYEDEKQRLGNIENSQEQLEGFGVRSDYGAKKTSIGGTFANEYKKLEDKKKFYEQAIKDENDKIDELEERLATLQEGTQEYLNTEKEIEAIKGGNEYIAMTTLITNTELEQNELLAQSQRDLTQVYMDEWTKRAERWGQWGEMFGEYLGEQVMLEKQANDARARGDLETAKKIEQQQKQNKQALIQNLLNKVVDEAALWAKEYALKMMFNSLMMAEDKRRAIEEVSLEGKKSTLSIFLNALTGQSKEHSKGLSGLVTGAIIFAATMALQAFAKSAIANMFPEAASGSTANRKLSTGMLTYAEGNYPVLGNDGKVYDAKYEGAGMKTGIYGGGAHFGIFSEKQPEMIVDGKTTQKLILNYPYIYDAITTIAKNGRLVNAMPTFASGDYPAGMNRIAQVEAVDISGGGNEDMIQMRATMEETREVNRQLLAILSSGRIVAHLDGLETHRQQKKNERFLNRRGID